MAINDTNIPETEQDRLNSLLASRTADGQPTASAPLPPPNPYYAAPPSPVYTKPPTLLERWKAKGGILGALASGLLLLAKIGAPVLLLLSKLKVLLIALKLLTFSKFLLGGGTMLLSMWAWATLYGWPFGIGIVLLIFIHECGHALAARMRGIPTGIMVFIPLMGAFVTTKRYGKNNRGRCLYRHHGAGVRHPRRHRLLDSVCPDAVAFALLAGSSAVQLSDELV